MPEEEYVSICIILIDNINNNKEKKKPAYIQYVLD